MCTSRHIFIDKKNTSWLDSGKRQLTVSSLILDLFPKTFHE